MLADIATADGWILGCTIVLALCGIGALILSVVALRSKQQVQVQQPFDVRLMEAFVVKSEFHTHLHENKRDFDSLRQEVKKDRTDNEIHASARSAGIYKRIGEVDDKLSAKIDAMPSKIIADLRNAKGLLEGN